MRPHDRRRRRPLSARPTPRCQQLTVDADERALDGPEGQFFRSYLLGATRGCAPTPGDWARLAARLQQAAPPPVRRAWVPAALWTHRFAFAPLVIAAVVGLQVLGLAPGTGFDDAPAVHTPAAPVEVEAVPAPTPERPARGLRPGALTSPYLGDAPQPTRDDRLVRASVRPLPPDMGELRPTDLLPGVDRDERINPFGPRPARSNVVEPTFPLRPGHFRFTSA